MSKYIFFDQAATTRCSDRAAELVQRFATQDYGNPSSSHAYGQIASKAIREARQYFSGIFNVKPQQVIFTAGGTESDNLAIYGVALNTLAQAAGGQARVLCSAIEHPAVKKTIDSLKDFGMDARMIPVDAQARVRTDELDSLVNADTAIVSIQQVNNIVGAVQDIQELARRCKSKQPTAVFHTDCVQAFGKVAHPVAGSGIDLVSISGHKIRGPKGIGALIVLNADLLKSGLRPLIWGGDQEAGFRSGTQNAGLIAALHASAEDVITKLPQNFETVLALQTSFREKMTAKKLLSRDPAQSLFRWNSPGEAVPHIVNLSFLQIAPGKPARGLPPGLFAKLLEDRGCLISTGSACSSAKIEPDPVLIAMGLPQEVCTASMRVSFASTHGIDDVDQLVNAFESASASIKQLSPG